MLCRKTVDLFTLLSHTGEAGTTRRMGMTQELLSLVTGLAHYLKILIRIALTGALKLDRDFNRHRALLDFLDKLQCLAVEGGNPAARRIVRTSRPREVDSNGTMLLTSGTEGVSYGYKSLAPENAGESPFLDRIPGSSVVNGNMSTPPSDLCLTCQKTVEEDCVRLGTYNRWHLHCVKCATCGRMANDLAVVEKSVTHGDDSSQQVLPEARALSAARRPPAKVDEFLFVPDAKNEDEWVKIPPRAICCIDHRLIGSHAGFSAVSRLEQFAFLLNVALRRLYLLLLRRGVMPLASAVAPPSTVRPSATHRNSSDIIRMKGSVHLDRKLSATARVPKRSTVVEAPLGKIAQPTDVQHVQRNGGHSQHPGPAGHHREKKGSKPAINTELTPAPPGLTTVPPTPVHTQPPPLVSHPSMRKDSQSTPVKIVDDVRSDGDHEHEPLESSHVHATKRDAPGGTAVSLLASTGFADSDEAVFLGLGDIPQLLESEQAREQHRSLPRLGDKPAIAELNPLELLIVKHFAVLALLRSPLKDQFDLDEILELIEMKKSTFWNRIFKGNDKKNIKKKGLC
jgi:hypothetical protein